MILLSFKLIWFKYFSVHETPFFSAYCLKGQVFIFRACVCRQTRSESVDRLLPQLCKQCWPNTSRSNVPCLSACVTCMKCCRLFGRGFTAADSALWGQEICESNIWASLLDKKDAKDYPWIRAAVKKHSFVFL